MAETEKTSIPEPPGGANAATWMIQSHYISLLRENELVTAELYALYSKRLHSASKFWADLATDENAHADVVMGIEQLINSGKASFRRPEGFRLPDIKAGVAWIRHLTDDVDRNGTTMREALDSAIKVEREMIESQFFQIMDSDDPEIRKEFEELHKHTVEHLAKITNRRRRLLW